MVEFLIVSMKSCWGSHVENDDVIVEGEEGEKTAVCFKVDYGRFPGAKAMQVLEG